MCAERYSQQYLCVAPTHQNLTQIPRMRDAFTDMRKHLSPTQNPYTCPKNKLVWNTLAYVRSATIKHSYISSLWIFAQEILGTHTLAVTPQPIQVVIVIAGLVKAASARHCKGTPEKQNWCAALGMHHYSCLADNVRLNAEANGSKACQTGRLD